jgi:outer membrane protein OmpA-like peptidoglycan-associated protein
MIKLSKKTKDSQNHWISISDMMSGLLMVFMFVAISYMLSVNEKKEQMRQIAVTYTKLQDSIYYDLYNEFRYDLEKWSAEIDKQTLSVRFKSPEILFETGSSKIKDKFRKILDDFFPRYIKILTKMKYKDNIEEIRIEGHTSSEWYHTVSKDEAYVNNMRLSQDRTRSVLEYVLSYDLLNGSKNWAKRNMTANGLSSSKLIMDNGSENKERSRRVEFRVKTNAEKHIVKIIEES